MNVLITGAAGFIGSHLTEFLVKKRYNVKVFLFIILKIIGDG